MTAELMGCLVGVKPWDDPLPDRLLEASGTESARKIAILAK